MDSGVRVGYVLKQYPRLSETFVLSEILGVEAAGGRVAIASLRQANEERFHPGIGRVQGLVTYLPQLDRHSFVSSLDTVASATPEQIRAVVDFIGLLPQDRGAGIAHQGIQLAKWARDNELDHLHAHFLTIAARTSHVAHLLTGIPYSVTAHAKDIYRHTVDWAVADAVVGASSATVTVCEANLGHLCQQLPQHSRRLVRIYNGVEPTADAVDRAERTRGLVVGVGRLVEKKGFDILIDALAKLAPRRPDLRCVLIGDGDQRSNLQDLIISNGLAGVVDLVGPLAQDEVMSWLRRAEVMAAPCRVGADGNQDALPTVLLEALDAGLPVVTTPVAGIPEIISDGVEGLIVPEEDPAAIASAIEALLEEESLWQKLSQNGPKKLAQRFDRRASAAQLVGIFEGGRK